MKKEQREQEKYMTKKASFAGIMTQYSRIKEEGAMLYPNDIEKYIQHKSPFIEKYTVR